MARTLHLRSNLAVLLVLAHLLLCASILLPLLPLNALVFGGGDTFAIFPVAEACHFTNIEVVNATRR